VSFGVSFRVDVRPYSGYDSPGLPIAAWISQGGTVGDASGGVINMDFLFQRDDDAQVSELFNLEQISVDTTSATSRDFTIQTLNMDNLAPNRPASTQKWKSNSQFGSGLSNSAFDLDNANILPLWLGAPNRGEGDVGLRIFWPNIDLLLFAVTLQGYMWGPRSVLAPGGPQRPVGGLFRA